MNAERAAKKCFCKNKIYHLLVTRNLSKKALDPMATILWRGSYGDDPILNIPWLRPYAYHPLCMVPPLSCAAYGRLARIRWWWSSGYQL